MDEGTSASASTAVEVAAADAHPAPRPRRRGRTAVLGVVAVTAVALAIAVLSVDRQPPGEVPGGGVPAPTPLVRADVQPGAAPAGRLLLGSGRDLRGRRLLPATGRPPLVSTHPQENPRSMGPPATGPGWVSGEVLGAQVVLADDALPWRWWIAPELEAAGLAQAVAEGVAAWDGIPGSTWASAAQGTHQASAAADGRSLVFLESACEGLSTANAYLFSDGGLGVRRYGTQTSQVLEADIGICPGTTDPEAVRRAVRHEVGHVIGLAHLCDPGDACHEEGMGAGPHGCRVMFWQARPCQAAIDDVDRLAVATTYPVLAPLAGTSPEETTARAAFAVHADRTAAAAVLLDAAADPALAAPAAAWAARAGGPLLLGTPDRDGCVGGAALRELNRVIARRGTVVAVGGWPASCRALGHDWDVRVVVVDEADPVEAAARLAGVAAAGAVGEDRRAEAAGPVGTGAVGAVVTAVDGADGPAPIRAALAAVDARVPVLLAASASDAERIADAIGAMAGPRAVALVDAPAGLGEALAVRGVEVRAPTAGSTGGASATGRGPEVGEGGAGSAAGPVVLTAQSGGPWRLAAVTTAAAEGGVVVLTPPRADPAVQAVLVATGATRGWVVGGDEVLDPVARAAYGAVLAAR